ncbi:MAG: hypothetical protein NHB36_06045 [Nitrospira sp.]|nr:hypothetical protein [Nitrospira sp.]
MFPTPIHPRRTNYQVGRLAPSKMWMHPFSLTVTTVCSFMLWSAVSHAATLTWSANTESDLAGYRVYQCTQLPCSRTAGTASLFAILGTVTRLDIGTPTTVRHYVVTAYDLNNNESSESNVATYTPPSSPPAPPVISVNPTSLSFTAVQGSGNPSPQTLTISNAGGGTLTWSSSDNAAWLTHTPQSGTGGGSITVSVATDSLEAGTYAATLTLSATGASSVTVPVTVTVTAPTVARPPRPLNLQLRSVVPRGAR